MLVWHSSTSCDSQVSERIYIKPTHSYLAVVFDLRNVDVGHLGADDLRDVPQLAAALLGLGGQEYARRGDVLST